MGIGTDRSLKIKTGLYLQVIAINQDITPQGRPLNSSDITQWARHLSDGSVAFAIYNPFDTPLQPQPLLFSALGWRQGTAAVVRDLWMHETLGTFTDLYDTLQLIPFRVSV